MTDIPKTMKAMLLSGHGGLDKYDWREDWPVPELRPGDVLIEVGACGLNNTDVKTRTGWYSKAVTEGTTGEAYGAVKDDDPTWGGRPRPLPTSGCEDVHRGHLGLRHHHRLPVAPGRGHPSIKPDECVRSVGLCFTAA